MSKTDTAKYDLVDLNQQIGFCETIINHVTVIKGFVQLRIKEGKTEEILDEIDILNEYIIRYLSQLHE